MFTGVTLPFTMAEIITGSMELVKVLGPVVMIAMAFMIVPRLISMMKGALSGRSKA